MLYSVFTLAPPFYLFTLIFYSTPSLLQRHRGRLELRHYMSGEDSAYGLSYQDWMSGSHCDWHLVSWGEREGSGEYVSIEMDL